MNDPSRGLFLFRRLFLRCWFALLAYCLRCGYLCLCLWLHPMLISIGYGILRPSAPYRLAAHDWICDSALCN